MLPKGRLGRKIRLHLKVYKGDKHPHAAQQPTDITSNVVSKRRNAPAQLAAKQ
jgi:large subunit ribosomal protein L13